MPQSDKTAAQCVDFIFRGRSHHGRDPQGVDPFVCGLPEFLCTRHRTRRTSNPSPILTDSLKFGSVPSRTRSAKKQARYTKRYIRTFVPPGKTTLSCSPVISPTRAGWWKELSVRTVVLLWQSFSIVAHGWAPLRNPSRGLDPILRTTPPPILGGSRGEPYAL